MHRQYHQIRRWNRKKIRAAFLATSTLFLVACGQQPESGIAKNSASLRGSRRGRHRQPVLMPLGTYETGIFDRQAAEIVDFHARTKQLYIVNTAAGTLDVVDIHDPSTPQLSFTIDVTPFGPRASSVAVHPRRRLIAAAIPNANAQKPGIVAFYSTDGTLKSVVQVGSNPDKVTFSPNGRWALTANEGIPSDDYSVDPEGSVSIIAIRGSRGPRQRDVRTADFRAYNGATLDPSIRIFGPGATVAQDLEPEVVAVSRDSKSAWVSMQENNAMAKIDIRSATVVDLVGLGFKDHSMPGNGLDASNRDNAINIQNWPVNGMYQPDSLATFRSRGKDFVLVANEGDAREYGAFDEEARVADLTLDPDAFPDAAALQQPQALGRLKITTTLGDHDGDGDYDQLFSYGARSFSIRTGDGELVFDSGDDFERITAARVPADFNSTNDENGSFDDRSDDKGPEPEDIVVGRVRGRKYAFIGLERTGGIMVYDVTDPYRARFVDYVNNRDFSGDPAMGTAGDLGPEGLLFIAARKSPTRKPLLVVANEVSGTTTVFEFRPPGGCRY